MIRMDRKLIIDMLTRHEGLRLKPYKDTVGKLTIGVGRNLDDLGISDHEAKYLLNNDIARVEKDLEVFSWYGNLSTNRKAVMTDMLFNLGLPRFLKFQKMIVALVKEQYNVAAAEILDSKAGRELYSRYSELAKIMKTDTMGG